jgi:hypothetical protein
MLTGMHSRKGVQMGLGLGMGIVFGFLLHKGGVTRYDVIVGQLLLEDFTVVKVMLSAVVVGVVGIHALQSVGLARLQPKAGSVGASAIGGLIFGVGFGLLGYCPGTVAGAVGGGALDALLGGVVGVLIGAGVFAALYPRLEGGVLAWGSFGDATLPRLLKVNAWAVAAPVAGLLGGLLLVIEASGV